MLSKPSKKLSFVDNWSTEHIREVYEVLRRHPAVIPNYEAEIEEPPEFTSIAETVEEAETRRAHGDQIVGLSSGYASIDRLTKGLVQGEMVIVMGHTSQGKSMLCQNIAYRVALRDDAVFMISLEMTHAETTLRFMNIAGAEEDVSTLPIIYPKLSDLTPDMVDRYVENAVAEGCKLVIIDHLHYFSRSVDNATAEIGRLVNHFKRIAVKHDVPLMLVSHIVKLATKTPPGLEHLRDSSFIAQDADIVLSVWRDMENISNELLVKVLKNRNRGFTAGQNVTALTISNGVRLNEARNMLDTIFPGAVDLPAS